MGCFLACFGFSNNKKRKRRNPSHRVSVVAQIKGSYEPLDSSPIISIGKAKNPNNAVSEPSDIDGQRTSQDGFSKQFCSSSISSKNGISSDPVVDENANNAMPLSVRDIHSVLSPVENLSQWRAAKAKSVPQKNQRKENIGVLQEPSEPSVPFRSNSNFSSSPLCNQSKPLLQEIKVDASLSSWLNSPITNPTATLETSNSWKIRGDRSVFEPTFLKAC
ncbi:hypothetical protein FEM48_Zijuj07G0094600 [Ziziphus jujuba var. spinosa]|uniref:Uncharacterized protein n=1 Tax=Ziziphus jujuba var. spinosa TaxID=714518 RepID=A0A978V3U6_ZIZJJ|nr:hypothetical protein FEM48_Zijuj07G0094600 [Ziziphus jujuba var. spinosa]